MTPDEQPAPQKPMAREGQPAPPKPIPPEEHAAPEERTVPGGHPVSGERNPKAVMSDSAAGNAGNAPEEDNTRNNPSDDEAPEDKTDNGTGGGPDDDPDDETDDAEGDELFEHFSVTADRGQTLLRLDKFLTVRMQHCSRNRIQTAIDSGNVLVNDRPAKSSYRIKPLDRVSVVMPYPKRDTAIVPQDIPLDIPYEDDDLLIVNKPAGMVVHPGHGNWDGTLVNALMYHLRNLPLFSEGDQRAGLVHRIDKNTSGLLVVAKNEQACARLAKQFFDHTITRRYVALVWGDMEADEGTITGHIGRSPRDRQSMCVFPDGSQGKHAVTHWRVLRRYGYVTLVECRLETGRTHQIRVHMQWQGHPLFADERYGGDRILKGTTFAKYRQFVENCFALMPRQALHARSLGFTHPTTRREIHFETPLPEDFQAVIDRWENYCSANKD